MIIYGHLVYFFSFPPFSYNCLAYLEITKIFIYLEIKYYLILYCSLVFL